MNATKKKRKFPVRPEFWDHRMRELRRSLGKNSPSCEIEIFMVFRFQMLLAAYYGSKKKAGIALLRAAFIEWKEKIISSCLMRFCDTMGWTKLYDIPETEDFIAHQQRHGRKCFGSPNCSNEHCIEDSCPKWFRWILRKRYE